MISKRPRLGMIIGDGRTRGQTGELVNGVFGFVVQYAQQILGPVLDLAPRLGFKFCQCHERAQ
jgi:hypothetical protein